MTAAGQTVAMLERKLFGGTCVTAGCIPTKTSVASAYAADLARRGSDYGVRTGPVIVDMSKVKAGRDGIVFDDRSGQGAFTHPPYNDFAIVAANLLDNDSQATPRLVSDRIATYALYIDPPLGRAGLTVEQVRKSGRPALVGQRPMTKVGPSGGKG